MAEKSKRNANDISKNGFIFNKTTGRYKSFKTSVKGPDGKSRPKRITFQRHITTLEEAIAEREKIEANLEVVHRISQKRLEYIKKLKAYEGLLEEFRVWRGREKKPKTVANNLSYLKNWSLRYFVDVKGELKYQHWANHYDSFISWLMEQKSERANHKSKDGRLSENTINNIIRSLNAFLKFLEGKTAQKLLRCSTLDVPPIKGMDYLLTEEELSELKKTSDESFEGSSDLVELLRYTGMRVMEGLGLTLEDITLGELSEKKKFINDTLRAADIKLYGYITLRKQLANDINSEVAETGKGQYVPLKHRKAISDRYIRYIPIISRELAEILKRRMLSCKATEKELLFWDCSYSRLRETFDEVYKEASTKKTPHDLRHTFITEIVNSLGGDVSLSIARDIWGHSEQKSLQRYVHLSEALIQEQQSTATLKNIEDIEIKAL